MPPTGILVLGFSVLDRLVDRVRACKVMPKCEDCYCCQKVHHMANALATSETSPASSSVPCCNPFAETECPQPTGSAEHVKTVAHASALFKKTNHYMRDDICKSREVSAREALPARKAELEHIVNRDMQESEAAFRR